MQPGGQGRVDAGEVGAELGLRPADHGALDELPSVQEQAEAGGVYRLEPLAKRPDGGGRVDAQGLEVEAEVDQGRVRAHAIFLPMMTVSGGPGRVRTAQSRASPSPAMKSGSWTAHERIRNPAELREMRVLCSG
ncbi:hypothetical protein [Glycomyces dulcitolivorans]|uniref:hypothetical protein n=1 Tax=Glycomyces dulcitolivorans TaxID=2200759 RepID=UPI000DD48A36|nr:hypothetical protein [Glycomyces dulcitolivorans]